MKNDVSPKLLEPVGEWANILPYHPFDIELERAEGVYLWDTSGNKYIDASGGPAAINLAHGEKRMSSAIAAQMEKFSYCHPVMANRPRADFCNALAEVTPEGLNTSFLVSGGSEAVESAIKLARQFHVHNGDVGKYKVIGRFDSYHGMTLTTQSLAGNPLVKTYVEPMIPQWPHIEQYSDYQKPKGMDREAWGVECAKRLEKAIYYAGPETVSAFIATPFGSGSEYGLMPPDSYWKEIRRICDEFGVLIIADEVVTGFGRTGKWFGMEHFGVQADIMTTAKGISGAYMPLGAVTMNDKVAKPFKDGNTFIHGFTNGGHALACVAGTTALEIIKEDNLVENSRLLGEHMHSYKEELLACPSIADVRGVGLCMVLELTDQPGERSFFGPEANAELAFQVTGMRNGLMLYSSLNGPRRSPLFQRGWYQGLVPPLSISKSELDEMMQGLLATIREWEQIMKIK